MKDLQVSAGNTGKEIVLYYSCLLYTSNHAKIEKSTMCMEYFEPAGTVKRPKTPSPMAGEGKL